MEQHLVVVRQHQQEHIPIKSEQTMMVGVEVFMEQSIKQVPVQKKWQVQLHQMEHIHIQLLVR